MDPISVKTPDAHSYLDGNAKLMNALDLMFVLGSAEHTAVFTLLCCCYRPSAVQCVCDRAEESPQHGSGVRSEPLPTASP